MDTFLAAITAIAVLAAVGSGVYAWRLLAGERRRSAARVAALAEAIDAGEVPAAAAGQPARAATGLFAPEHSDAARGFPAIRLAVGLAMAVLVMIVLAVGSRESGDGTTGAETVAAAAHRPLELLSMRHERDGETLRVLGLVRNPRSGATLERVTAVVFAFNRAGAFVASGRAALDFTTLDPGDESPFVVTIPGLADVGRYRVSFRADSGGTMRHIDRRADQTRLATR